MYVMNIGSCITQIVCLLVVFFSGSIFFRFDQQLDGVILRVKFVCLLVIMLFNNGEYTSSPDITLWKP